MNLDRLTDITWGLFLTWLTVLATIIFVDAFAPIRLPVLVFLAGAALLGGYTLSMARRLQVSDR